MLFDKTNPAAAAGIRRQSPDYPVRNQYATERQTVFTREKPFVPGLFNGRGPC